MMRILTPAVLLAMCTGCLSLDFLVFSAPTTDEYVLDEEVLDSEDVEFVTFETPDGFTLHGVWVRGDNPQPPLIYFHGNSTKLDDKAEHGSSLEPTSTEPTRAVSLSTCSSRTRPSP